MEYTLLLNDTNDIVIGQKTEHYHVLKETKQFIGKNVYIHDSIICM